MSLRCYRDTQCPWRYVVRDHQGFLYGTVERLDPPNNSHIAIWIVEDVKPHFMTRRDALQWLEKRGPLVSGGARGDTTP